MTETEFHHGEMPHKPAPPEEHKLIPNGQMFIRGLGLAALALAALAGARESLRHGLWLAPLALPCTFAAALAAWAAAIHITGGEKFDDHPWV